MDSKDFGPEHNRGHRFVLVVIDNFSKLGWTLLLKNKKFQTIKDSFQNVLISSKRSPRLVETSCGKNF